MAETTEHLVDDEANVEESASSVNAVSDIENQRQINDLRSEYLDDRAASLNQWLVVIGLVLAFFAVAIPVVTGIAAYVAYTQFQRIESEAAGYLKEAKGYANEAAQYLKDIQAQKKIAEEVVSGLTSEDIRKLIQSGESEVPLTSGHVLRKVREDPEASVIDRAIVSALTLQQEGKVDEAIKKLSAIANTLEGIDNDKAAEMFLARGVLKGSLGKHDEMISDCSEAIRLNPNLEGAILLRGIAKNNLDRYQEAISDYNEVIRLNPDLADAYVLRARAKNGLHKVEEAKVDYQMGLKLAEQQGLEYLGVTIATIEEEFQGLKNKE